MGDFRWSLSPQHDSTSSALMKWSDHGVVTKKPHTTVAQKSAVAAKKLKLKSFNQFLYLFRMYFKYLFKLVALLSYSMCIAFFYAQCENVDDHKPLMVQKCISALVTVSRSSAPFSITVRQAPCVGRTDVLDLVCLLRFKRKFILLFSPSIPLPLRSPFCLQLLLVCIEVRAIAGASFHEPSSDALASKLCKCILPVKLKLSLLVLRSLLHRVLHHSFGSGPLDFPP